MCLYDACYRRAPTSVRSVKLAFFGRAHVYEIEFVQRTDEKKTKQNPTRVRCTTRTRSRRCTRCDTKITRLTPNNSQTIERHQSIRQSSICHIRTRTAQRSIGLTDFGVLILYLLAFLLVRVRQYCRQRVQNRATCKMSR